MRDERGKRIFFGTPLHFEFIALICRFLATIATLQLHHFTSHLYGLCLKIVNKIRLQRQVSR